MPGRGRDTIFLLLALAAASSRVAPAQDASFELEARSPTPYTAAYLGNGAMGLETTPLGTTPAHCYLAGVYDETPGDVARIASAPAWNEVDVFYQGHWLNRQPPGSLQSYRQVLDMYNGVLRTEYTWVSNGKRLAVHVAQFVSRDRPDTAAVSVTLIPQAAGQIKVRLPLRNWPPPHRYELARLEKLEEAAQKDPWLIWYPGRLKVTDAATQTGANHAVLSLLSHAPGTGATIAEAVALDWPQGAKVEANRSDPQIAQLEVLVDATPGAALKFTKYAAIERESSAATPAKAIEIAKSLQTEGWARLLSQHTNAWHSLWNSDIRVEGDPALQRVIHSMLFYLLGSARKDVATSTPPMGLSSSGYFGHIFWDADTFLYPALLILHPELAHSMVAFRSRTREEAVRNAAQNGFRGAMYPWEAGPDGAEVTPRFAAQNAKFENHINGDVALAAWQYWLATGDHQWLEKDCWPILRDTADFWVSRVSFNAAKKRYEIGKVVGVNESLIGISNDAWTNAIAQKNLRLAVEAARLLSRPVNPKWQAIANALYLPPPDSPLFWFPLDQKFPPAKTREELESAMKWIRAGNDGAMMHGEFYPIMAAQMQDRQLIGQMIGPLSTRYLRPPFQVVAETPLNRNTNFITGAGAFLQQFVFGYSGLRLTAKGLVQQYPAVLPPGVSKLTLRNISVRGKLQTLTFSSNSR